MLGVRGRWHECWGCGEPVIWLGGEFDIEGRDEGWVRRVIRLGGAGERGGVKGRSGGGAAGMITGRGRNGERGDQAPIRGGGGVNEVRAQISVHVRVHVHVCVRVRACVRVHVHVRVRACASMFCIRVCACLCESAPPTPPPHPPTHRLSFPACPPQVRACGLAHLQDVE